MLYCSFQIKSNRARTETGRKRIPVIRHLSQAPPCPTGYAVSCSRVHSACAFASPDTSREVNSLSPRKIEICSFAAAGVPAPKPRVVCPPFIRVLREPPPDARQNLQRRLVTHSVRHRADHVFCKPKLLSRTIPQSQVPVVLVAPLTLQRRRGLLPLSLDLLRLSRLRNLSVVSLRNPLRLL